MITAGEAFKIAEYCQDMFYREVWSPSENRFVHVRLTQNDTNKMLKELFDL